MQRYFYRTTFAQFINASKEQIFGTIASMDDGDSVSEQKYAWSEEIELMKQVLLPWKNER